MATGIIESVSVDLNGLKSGTVKTDETGDLLTFSSQSFECDVLDPVQFDIIITKANSIASNLVCLTGGVVNHPDSPIKTPVSEDIIVGSNEKLVIRGKGHVTGNIIINGGKLKVVKDGHVTGNIIINKSGTVVISDGELAGDIEAQEAELIKVVGNGKVTGNVIILKGHRMVLNEGEIGATLDVKETYKVVIKGASKIG